MANEPALQLVKTDASDTPHNLPAEMAVLGAVLFDNNAYQRIGDILRATDFYAPANGAIYEVAQQLILNGRVADGVTLREHFDRDGELAEIGGAQYLTDLLDSAAFGPEVTDYANLIRDLAVRRELIDIGSEVVQTASRGDQASDGAAQIEAAERRLFDLAERGTSSGGFENFGS
ncbi:MAG: DnaB-like helicase N-terminal domain-containing protein, partial [Pseudomonadota bacterium]